MNFVATKLDKVVPQILSNKKKIEHEVGDKPYTAICDYMESCSYVCTPNKNITEDDVKLDTYNENFIMANTEKIIQRIKMLFKDSFFYDKAKLIKNIQIQKEYPIIQINAALSQLIEDKNEFLSDKYNRLGNLINIGTMYFFQPLELNNTNISLYDRSVPIEYKRDKLVFEVPKSFDDKSQKEMEEMEGPNEDDKDIGDIRDIGDIEEVEHKKLNKKTKNHRAKVLLKNMEAVYNTVKEKHIIMRGEEDWYKYCSIVIERLLKDTDLMEKGLTREILYKFVLNTYY